LVKCYNVPPELVVNTDQISIHLMPIGEIRTWEEKGAKSMVVVGQDDKRQVTVAVSSSAGDILLFKVIFTGTIRKILPPMNVDCKFCEDTVDILQTLVTIGLIVALAKNLWKTSYNLIDLSR
jgi:hypothetical protein